MYDGFDRDLRRALDEGDAAVAEFIHQTAKARNIDPFDVFAATARRRLAWERDDPGERDPPRRQGSGRSRRQRRPRPGTSLRRLLGWRKGRRRLPRVVAVTMGAAGRQLRRAGGRLVKAGARAARRQAARAWKRGRQWARRHAAEWGRVAYGLGHWLVKRRWPTPAELRRGPAEPGRPAAPRPSPAVQALLDGYSYRESVYLFGERDPLIRDPADDWPGALKDFNQAIRQYVTELRQYAEEVPTHDRPRADRAARNDRPARPRRDAPPPRPGERGRVPLADAVRRQLERR